MLLLGTWALAATAIAKQPAADITGVYHKGGDYGADLAILQGDNETLAYYEGSFPQGQSVGTCECPLVLDQMKSPDLWTLKSADSPVTWTLRIEPKKLVLESHGTPECCGAGWPGVGPFERGSATPPQSCKVKAPRAWFHASDAKNTQRKAYLVSGDAVQAYIPGPEPDFVPGRFKGPKATVVGQLKLEELDCREQEASKPTAPAAQVDLKPFVGKWLRTKRQGERYIIEKPCSANIPSVVVKPGGELEVDYGQEIEQMQITGLKPGPAASTYTLQITRAGGSNEALEWTVVDGKKEIIRLKGGADFFRDGELFIREDKKGEASAKSEKCDELER